MSDYRITEDGQVEWLQHKAAQGELPESAQLALDVIKLRAQVNAVRALHRRVTISEDWGDEVQCAHCVDGDGNGHLWPCLTARALEVAP